MINFSYSLQDVGVPEWENKKYWLSSLKHIQKQQVEKRNGVQHIKTNTKKI